MPVLILFISLLSLLNNTSLAQSPKLVELQKEAESILADPVFNHGQFAFTLRSNQGNLISSVNSEKSLNPASNLKILTTAASLGILGEDFTFSTILEYDGYIDKDGMLEGNLYIKGGGDPTLGSDRFKSAPNFEQVLLLFAEKVKAAGIKKINGSVIGDGTIFDQNILPNGWIWADIGNYFGAGVSGLNIHDNLYRIYFKPGDYVNAPALIEKIAPEIPGLKFNNNVTTGDKGTGDNAYIYGSPFTDLRYISGTIPYGTNSFSIKGAIPDPSFFCAYALNKILEDQNIEIGKPPLSFNNKAVQEENSNRTSIYVHTSPKLSEIVMHTNIYSINLYAEAMLKVIGLHVSGYGSTEAGIKVLKDYWGQKGIDLSGMILFDGSGLSPLNVITSEQLSQVLHLILKQSYFDVFYKSLPRAGVSGTVSRLCKGTIAEGKISLKSGSMGNVLCYTGYVESKTKGRLSFSMMANNFECPNGIVIQKMEKLLVLMAGL